MADKIEELLQALEETDMFTGIVNDLRFEINEVLDDLEKDIEDLERAKSNLETDVNELENKISDLEDNSEMTFDSLDDELKYEWFQAVCKKFTLPQLESILGTRFNLKDFKDIV